MSAVFDHSTAFSGLQGRAFDAWAAIEQHVSATGGQVALYIDDDRATLGIRWPGREGAMRVLTAPAGYPVVYLFEPEEDDVPEPGVEGMDDPAEAIELAFTVGELRQHIDGVLQQYGIRLLLTFDGKRVTVVAADDPGGDPKAYDKWLDGAVGVASFRRFKPGEWPTSPDEVRVLPWWFAAKLARSRA